MKRKIRSPTFIESSFTNSVQASFSCLTRGDAVRAAGHRVDDADQTQAAGRQRSARAKDAVVRRGLRVACGGGLGGVAGGGRGRCRGHVFDGEAAGPGAPVLQCEHNGHVFPWRRKRRRVQL